MWFKKEDPIRPDKIRKQAEFLYKVFHGDDKRHRELETLFPRLVYAFPGDRPYYETEYLGWEWIRADRLLTDNRGRSKPAVDQEDAEGLLTLILDTLHSKFYRWQIPSAQPDAPRLLFGRWNKRVDETRALLVERKKVAPQMSDIEVLATEWFMSTLDSEKLRLNGALMRNAPGLLEEMRNDSTITRLLESSTQVFSHGDPHLGNIFVLYRPGSPEHLNRIKFIDPGADWEYGDVAYDLAKIAHSIHGRYDFLVDGLFDWRLVMSPGASEISFTLTVPFNGSAVTPTPGGSGAEAFLSGPRLTGSEVRLYNGLWERFFEIIRDRAAHHPDYEFLQVDETLETRVLLYEASHFLTMAPYHIVGADPRSGSVLKAFAMYLTGVQLLNDALASMRLPGGAASEPQDSAKPARRALASVRREVPVTGIDVT